MILVAPDKFKGTFSAEEICRLVVDRLRKAGITESICCRPLSDGGEGIASVLMPDALKISTGVYEKNGRRLVVSSEIVGFEAFENKNLPLMKRSSFRLGQAVEAGVPTIVAVGGTAISDGGAGFLQGLGAKFYNSQGNLINDPLTPDTLKNVSSADLSALARHQLEGIIDVRASLTEGELTALDFAEQKAQAGEDLSEFSQALAHFQEILGGSSPWDGAGGGLGYSLGSVCKVPCRSGAEYVIDSLDIDWAEVSLIITGEGCVDRQTSKGGKLVDALYQVGKKHNIPTLIIYGRCEDPYLFPKMAQLNQPWEHTVQDFL